MSVKWLGSIARGGIFVGSIYLHSGEGLSARNVRLLEEAARVLISLPGPWVLAGDFQIEPLKLIEAGFPRLAKGVVVAPCQPTCHEHTIDYFVVAEGLVGSVFQVTTLAESPFDPHSPVRLLLRAGPRSQRIRVLAKPAGIPAVLPSGCQCSYEGEWFGDDDAGGGGNGQEQMKEEELDGMYAKWLSAAELVWCDVATEGDREIMMRGRRKAQERARTEGCDDDMWSVRGNGARFVWVTAVGRPAVNAPTANKTTVA